MNLPQAEKLNFWKTGRDSPDGMIDKAIAQIQKLGGEVLSHAFGDDIRTGTSVYMIAFEIEGQRFKIVWPVLPCKSEKDRRAARRQAATMLYHDVKSRCLYASVHGAPQAFINYLMLPDGRTIQQMSTKELPSISKMLQIEEK